MISRGQEQAVRDTDNRDLMGPRRISFSSQWPNASVPIGYHDHFLLEGSQRGLHLMDLSSGLFFFCQKKKKPKSNFHFMSFVSSSKRMPVGSGNLSSIASPFGLSKAMNVIRALNPSEDMQIRAFKRFTFILHRP